MSDKIRLNLEVSSKLNEKLENIAEQMDLSKSDVVRRAIGILGFVLENTKNGNTIAVKDEKTNTLKYIVTL